jgi:hypothetical protein
VGWRGEVRGLVEFGGLEFYPVLGTRLRFGPPGSAWLTGCVVVCTDPYVGLHEASLLAGHSRRLSAVRTPPTKPKTGAKAGHETAPRIGVFDAVDVQLQAALLDQGVVIQDTADIADSGTEPRCGCAVLSWPGEVVASPLQRDNRWRRDRRRRTFYNTVTAAPTETGRAPRCAGRGGD